MSDYTITHGHLQEQQERAQADAELEEWIDSFPARDTIAIPTCGMCKSFIPDRSFKTLDGKAFISPSHCKARAVADLPPFYKASDSAEKCPYFDYDYPF
jgi:Pyruvate/2-oxoacid:ferredoxin oxidoreductase delta subunit